MEFSLKSNRREEGDDGRYLLSCFGEGIYGISKLPFVKSAGFEVCSVSESNHGLRKSFEIKRYFTLKLGGMC
jgi:hypothetical protein